jgi:hypothetical protein
VTTKRSKTRTRSTETSQKRVPRKLSHPKRTGSLTPPFASWRSFTIVPASRFTDARVKPIASRLGCNTEADQHRLRDALRLAEKEYRFEIGLCTMELFKSEDEPEKGVRRRPLRKQDVLKELAEITELAQSLNKRIGHVLNRKPQVWRWLWGQADRDRTFRKPGPADATIESPELGTLRLWTAGDWIERLGHWAHSARSKAQRLPADKGGNREQPALPTLILSCDKIFRKFTRTAPVLTHPARGVKEDKDRRRSGPFVDFVTAVYAVLEPDDKRFALGQTIRDVLKKGPPKEPLEFSELLGPREAK